MVLDSSLGWNWNAIGLCHSLDMNIKENTEVTFSFLSYILSCYLFNHQQKMPFSDGTFKRVCYDKISLFYIYIFTDKELSKKLTQASKS